jgi:hypothetical protein
MAQSVDFPRGPTKRSRWTSLWKKTAAAAKVAETSQPEPTRQRDGNRPVSLWSLIWELQGCIRMYQDVWDWFPSCCDLKSHDFLLPIIAANYTSEGILMNSSRSCSLPISLSITIHHCLKGYSSLFSCSMWSQRSQWSYVISVISRCPQMSWWHSRGTNIVCQCMSCPMS